MKRTSQWDEIGVSRPVSTDASRCHPDFAGSAVGFRQQHGRRAVGEFVDAYLEGTRCRLNGTGRAEQVHGWGHLRVATREAGLADLVH